MTPAEAVDLLERLLAQVQLYPEAIWEVFQDWARRPVACERDERGASIGYAEGEAWIEFRRTFADPRPEWEGEVTLRLFSARPDAPRLPTAEEVCDDPRELGEFFGRVEDLPAFGMALRYPYWEFEVIG